MISDIFNIPFLLIAAWLLPLLGFMLEIFGGYWQRGRLSKAAAYWAVGCIGTGFLLSTGALAMWLGDHGGWSAILAEGHHGSTPLTGEIYKLAHFGNLKLSIDYYIDSLTLVMFMMVTFISTCIHIFALGYMSD